MNLGTTVIKAVNSSKPEIHHINRIRSAAAESDEYLSYSEYVTDSSGNTQITALRYETPPSRTQSPATTRAPVDSGMTLPQRPDATLPSPLNVRFSKIRSIREIPVESVAKDPVDLSPPTPGIDDAPYIRFAIDQLTRDEELLGRGRQGSVTSADYPVQRTIPDEGLGYYSNNAPVTQQPLPPGRPNRHRRSTAPSRRDRSPERLVPVDIIPAHCPDMGFVPIALRFGVLLTTIFLVILFIGALIFCNIWSSAHHGFCDYIRGYDGRYFLFQYLPQLLGILIITWLFVIQSAFRRTIPFMMISSHSEPPYDRVVQEVSLLSANFVLPDLSYFKTGERAMGICELIFWLNNFSVPLLSCAFQTKQYRINGRETWRWTSVQGVVWTLVALYTLLVIALFMVFGRFSSWRSPLCWDPVSLADLIPMFRRSNILNDYDRSEISGSIKTHVPARRVMLGYWRTTKSAEVFYTIGEENAPFQSYSDPKSSFDDKSGNPGPSPWDIEAQRYSNASSFVRNIHSPFVRYRWIPWFLRDSVILAWVIIAIVLFLVWVTISFFNQTVRLGFKPLLPTLPDSAGFSPSNFLYSFLPALLGMFFFLAWQPIDLFFRAVQPFASLCNPRGATASESLLLSYPSCFPIEVTILALINRHYRVAWISFMAVLSAGIPVLAGGVFTAQFFPSDREVRVAADIAAYYLLVIIGALYTFSFMLIWPTRKRYLPHRINTIADILSFVYQSNLLRDGAFRQPASKADLVGRLITTPLGEERVAASRTPKYAFGVYIGRDGREHLGIDRLQRPGSGEMLISSQAFAG